jgi:antitoxin component YwqK of YwqJK toxin-antitoxin module
MRNILFILLLNYLLSNIQSFCQTNDTVFNQKDAQGRKQGFWKVKYENGTIKYTAFFKDDKPRGILKRYFDDNTIKAILEFNASGIKARAKVFYQAGPLAEEGNFINSLKDSIWNYYSYYTKNLSSKEHYVNGKRNGLSICYYTDGKVAEELEWKNDVRDGIWRQYYDNGNLKLSSLFVNDKRNGLFILYYPNAKMEWKGSYKDDKRESQWTHYDPVGKVVNTIDYKNGIATNADVLDAKEDEDLKQIEKQKGKFSEPDETNVQEQGRE